MNTEILALFRVIAPEFNSVSDNDVIARIEFVKPFIGQTKFGELYTRAVALYTAHTLALQRIIDNEGSIGGSITAGSITMEKEGDLQRSYGASVNSDSLLSKTAYGKQYLQLLKMCILAVKTRFG